MHIYTYQNNIFIWKLKPNKSVQISKFLLDFWDLFSLCQLLPLSDLRDYQCHLSHWEWEWEYGGKTMVKFNIQKRSSAKKCNARD